MQFAPKSEEEVKRKLLEPGEADVEVLTASEEVSDKGNAMIKLKVKLYDSKGEQGTIYDYLMEKMAYKLRHAAYAFGLGHKYESGELEAEDFLGKSGRCKIRIKQDQGYDPKNEIADYVVADSTKKTENYQASKSNGAGAAAAEVAKKSAWATFQRIYQGEANMLNTAWKKAFADYFQGAEAKSLNAFQWKAFEKDAFERKAVPVGEDVFKEDDIPF